MDDLPLVGSSLVKGQKAWHSVVMTTKSVRPLRLTLDAAFKLYFKDNPHLQKSLLENFLPLPEGSTIESVSLLDAEDNSSEPEGKTFILDLKISILRREGDKLKQESANVEMQSIDKADFINRVYAYSARMYSSQARKGTGLRHTETRLFLGVHCL